MTTIDNESTQFSLQFSKTQIHCRSTLKCKFMIGNWLGFYRYNNKHIQKIKGFDKTYFSLTINSFDGNNFKGTVTDDTSTGGMEGTGEVIGNIENEKIFFRKFMHKKTFIIDTKGTRKISDVPHPTLYYSGTFTPDKMEINGDWKFNYTIGFLFGFIPIPYRPAKGTWNIHLVKDK